MSDCLPAAFILGLMFAEPWIFICQAYREEYFGMSTDVDAVVYLMLASELVRSALDRICHGNVDYVAPPDEIPRRYQDTPRFSFRRHVDDHKSWDVTQLSELAAKLHAPSVAEGSHYRRAPAEYQSPYMRLSEGKCA